MSGDREVPKALRRCGIKGVTDDAPPGFQVRLPAGAFFTWFGEALLARAKERAAHDATADTQTQGDDHAD